MKKGLLRLAIFSAFLGLASGLSAQKNDLARTEDAVILNGDRFPELLGREIPRLSVLALRRGALAPIPFQVDEKTPKGDYVFESGKNRNSDPDPNFDANDELVFMVFDAGDRAAKFDLPGLLSAHEITIKDPLGRGQAWAYLALFEKDAPRSAVDYIRAEYDKATNHNLVTASNYMVRTRADAIVYDHFALPGPDGKFGPNLIDQFKIRGNLSLLWGRMKFPFNFDELVKSKVTAVKDGPVRVIRQGEGYLDIAQVKIKGAGFAVLFFYPNFFVYPMTIDFPIDLRKMLTDIDVQGFTDYSKTAYGSHYYDAQNPYNPEVVLDGKMSDAEKNLEIHFDHDWLCHVGTPGNVCHRIWFSKEWDFLKKEVVYIDDDRKLDPPENQPGVHAMGYNLVNFINLKKGPQTYWMHYYFPANFKLGQEYRFLDVLDHPLAIETAKAK